MSLEILERHRDSILFNDAVELVDEVGVELVDGRAFLFGIAAVVDADLLVGVVELPRLPLILVVKVNNEERVLEIDEEVPHVRHLLRLFLIFNDVQRGVSPLVVLVYLVFQLLLGVAAGDVFDAQVGPQVRPLLHQVDLHGLVIASLIIRLGMVRASVLRTACAFSVVRAFGMVGVWRLIVESMVRELILTIVMSAHDVKTADRSRSIYLLASRRLHHVIDVERARPMHRVLQRAHHYRRTIQPIDVANALLARTPTARVEGLGRRAHTLIALTLLLLKILVTVLATVTEVRFQGLLLLLLRLVF